MGKFTDKIAVITGGIQDITLAVVKRFLEEDVKAVAVLDQNAEAAKEALLALDPSGKRAAAYACSIGNFEDVTRVFAAIKAELGDVDILINNPNAKCEKTLLETTPEEWNAVLAVNTHSMFYCCKQVFADMKARKTGKVINLSAPEIFGVKGNAAYAVSKATVLGYNGAVSREMEKYTVTSNTVIPAANATAEEVAGTIAILASEEGRYAHGQTVTVTHSFAEQ